jgi:hypothetical protein
MPMKNRNTEANQQRDRELLLVRVEAGSDKGPELIQHVGQHQQEGNHQGNLHRHQEYADHVGGDHLAARRQGCQQGCGEQRIQLPGVKGQRHEYDADRNQDPDQAVTQFDQMREEGFLFFSHQAFCASAVTGTGS